jgi:hypothetical protein
VVQETSFRIDDGVLIDPPASAPSEDLPRHGAPAAFGGRSAAVASGNDRAQSRTYATLSARVPAAGSARIISFHQTTVYRATVRSHALASPAAVQAPRPKPVPRAPAPSAPAPFILGAGVAPAHDGGIGVVTALASGLAMVLLYSISTALRLVLVVPPDRAAGANPHPPG